MAIVQGRTRAQLRQSIGYNLGAVYVSSSSSGGSTTTIVDNTLRGADDNHNGKWVVFNDANGNAGQITRVSDYTSSNTTLTLSPAVDATPATDDTYELWSDIYSPNRINDLINQGILDATGHAWDPVEKLDLHTDGKDLSFAIPSGISMIQDIYYRDKVESTRIHSCNAKFDETVDSDFTPSVDTEDKKQGTGSNKFVIVAGASAGDFATDSIASKDLRKYTHVEFWVKSTVATSAGNLKLHLDNTPNCDSPEESISIPALSADTWTFVRDKIDNPELCSTIVSVGLEMDSDLGAVTVWLDDISAVRSSSAHWIKVPRNLWRIDKEAKEIVMDKYVHGVARYNLLKLVGGDKPALLTSDSGTSEIDEQYLISRATALAFASASGGPQTDPDDKNNMAGFWMGLSSAARRAFPLLTNVRLVE